MDVQSILKLMVEMKNSGIASLNWQAEGQSLQLTRPATTMDSSMIAALAAEGAFLRNSSLVESTENPGTKRAVATDVFSHAETVQPKGRVVSSPVVGVFYAAAAPDQDAFVSIGSQVERGTPLGIIEAMKLMNEVTSPSAGTIVDILIENTQRVEYGQPLFVIEETIE